jgi:nucleoid-associated protein YgaU
VGVSRIFELIAPIFVRYLSSRMRLRRISPCLSVLSALALTGCGYVHLGRLPVVPPATRIGDDELLKENSNLRTEKKILQQELALTRAQGDALRMAIENRAADGDTSKRLTEKLNQTTRELATLRADYAKLQQDRGFGPVSPTEFADLKAKLGATEDKLASSLKNYTQLQEEIGRLRTDLDQTRSENTALTVQVKAVTAQSEEAQAALAQLNSDLLAQKNLRAAAEQDATTLRTQLASANSKVSALAQQRTAAAADARALTAPSAEAKPGESAELRGQLDALRKRVFVLEGERDTLQQKLTAAETAAQAPALAEIKARAETESKLTAALQSARMLRAENDSLKASTDELARTKSALQAELDRAKTVLPLANQAQSLRDQLAQVQTQAATLVDENTKLKARLALMGGSSSRSTPIQLSSGEPSSAPSSAPGSAAPSAPTPGTSPGAVTATFVTNVPGAAGTNAANAATRNRATGTALRFHTVTSGDTLSKISATYYGTPARWAEILVANRDILGEDNNLVIGRTLRIP